jgi:hypothetical protein
LNDARTQQVDMTNRSKPHVNKFIQNMKAKLEGKKNEDESPRIVEVKDEAAAPEEVAAAEPAAVHEEEAKK